MKNSLLRKLKGEVYNDSLDILGAMMVQISEYNPQEPSGYKNFLVTNTASPITVTAVSGRFFIKSGSDYIEKTTYTYNAQYYFPTIYIKNDESPLLKIESKYKIWGLGYPDETEDAWFRISFSNILGAVGLTNFNATTLSSTFKVEDWFESVIQQIKEEARTVSPTYLPTIINTQPSLIESQRGITFKGQPFYNKLLALDRDAETGISTLYKTRTGNISDGYSYSDAVATFNENTGEWTYLE